MSKHGLSFSIEGATISVDEMADYVATWVYRAPSERAQEDMAHQITHALMECVGKKVLVARADQSRKAWVERHPPNHAGYYYCHLCGGWVHQSEAELDEIEPRSVRRGEDPLRDDNRRMAHTWPITAPDGTQVCPGNRGKGSRAILSVTQEIAPPDTEL